MDETWMPPKAQSHPESLRFKNRFVTGDSGETAANLRAAPKGQGPRH
jgi:hypothetical protein